MATIETVLAEEDPTRFAIALSELVFPRWNRDGFEALTHAERVAYCVDALEREVNNGGFAQFFANSAGDTAWQTLEALEVISATTCAGIIGRAIAVFGTAGVPLNRDERLDALDALGDEAGEQWESLDAEFYSYPDDLASLLRQYVQAHVREYRSWSGT